MISMVSSFFYLSALFILVVFFFLFYTKAWKTLIRSSLNMLIDFFYRRITTDKDRPGKFRKCTFDVQLIL